MERSGLIDWFTTFEQQLIEAVERVDATREKILHLPELGGGANESTNALVNTLHQDVMQLRELSQVFSLKKSLLMTGDGEEHLGQSEPSASPFQDNFGSY